MTFRGHQKWHKRIKYRQKRIEKLMLENDGPIYKGDPDKKRVIEFHKKYCELRTSWHKIIEHVKVDDKYMFKCKTCGDDSFDSMESFIAHAVTHTGEKTYICRMPECSSAFGDWESLHRHVIEHFGPRKKRVRKLTCNICGGVSYSKPDLIKHMSHHKHIEEQLKRDLEKNDDTSEEDEQIFDRKDPSLQDLIDFHQKLKIKPKFLSRLTETIVEGDKLRYKCTTCGTKSEERKDHEIHLLMHSSEKLWMCRVAGCSRSFRDFPTLEGHLLSHCNGDEKKFVCDICGMYFETEERLTKHFPNHTTDKKFKCDYCSAEFSELKKKEIHTSRHNPGNEALKKCDFCENVFLNGLLLSNHVRKVHNIYLAIPTRIDQRRYNCDICGKSYKTSSGLKSHYKNHTNERNSQCQYCSAMFKDNHEKNIHEFHHNPGKEVLLKCDLCDDVFLNSQLLNSHLRRDHGIAVIIEKIKKTN